MNEATERFEKSSSDPMRVLGMRCLSSATPMSSASKGFTGHPEFPVGSNTRSFANECYPADGSAIAGFILEHRQSGRSAFQ